MTVDVEDYFHVSAFAEAVRRDDWDGFESRVCDSTERLLAIFDRAGVQATFFVLGWVAHRFPNLVRRINDAGHELASHGFHHELVYRQSPETFRADLEMARAAIEDASGVAVKGYRAPSFSVTTASSWALDVLVAQRYTFDASIYPIRHDRYGIPSWPRHPHRIILAGGPLWELPGSTVRLGGINLPIGGGGYFRLLPYEWTRSGIRVNNEREGQPVVFYLHPWEIDPDQPRIRCSRISAVRHYRNLDKTQARLERLLAEFRFGTVSSALAAMAAAPGSAMTGRDLRTHATESDGN